MSSSPILEEIVAQAPIMTPENRPDYTKEVIYMINLNSKKYGKYACDDCDCYSLACHPHCGSHPHCDCNDWNWCSNYCPSA